MKQNRFKKRIRFFIGCLVLLTTACSTFSGVGKDNRPSPSPLVNFSAERNVHTLWRAQVGAGASKAHPRFDTVVSQGVVYTVSAEGTATAVNAANGKTLWSANTNTSPSSGPAVQSGYLIFGTNKGEVVALRSCNGALIWRAVVSSELLAPPVIASEWVLVKTVDGKLVALDLRTGQCRWDFAAHKTPLTILPSDSAPVVSRSVVFVGFSDGQFAALRLQTGQLIWEQMIAVPGGLGDPDNLVGIVADPIVSGSVLYVAAHQDKLVALSTQTGAIIWQRSLSTYNNFALSGGLIVISDDDGRVWGIHRLNGRVLWQQNALLNRPLTAPLMLNEEVWVGDSDGYLHVLSSRDGHLLARCLIDSTGLFTQPALCQNGVLVRAEGGALVKLATSLACRSSTQESVSPAFRGRKSVRFGMSRAYLHRGA